MCDNFPKCSSELFFDDIKNIAANWMRNCIKKLAYSIKVYDSSEYILRSYIKDEIEFYYFYQEFFFFLYFLERSFDIE